MTVQLLDKEALKRDALKWLQPTGIALSKRLHRTKYPVLVVKHLNALGVRVDEPKPLNPISRI